jgi:hypothetical protein
VRPSSVVLKSTSKSKPTAKAKASTPSIKTKAKSAPAKTATKPTRVVAVKAAPPVSPSPAQKSPGRAPAAMKVATKPSASTPSKPAALKATPAKATPASKPTPDKPSAATKQGAAKAIASGVAEPAPSPKRPARKSIKEAAGVSTDAVARRTGKSWDDWFEVLDSAGAAALDQRGVIAILAQKHGIGPWWQQMIAVGYESLRGKSDKPPAADGFQINSSCTLDAPLPRVFRLWNDAGERARWLADDRFVVRGATADKVIRARWGKGNSHVSVSFTEKSGRTEVNVDHHQIESRGAAEQMKAYWAKKLGLLDEALAPRAGNR